MYVEISENNSQKKSCRYRGENFRCKICNELFYGISEKLHGRTFPKKNLAEISEATPQKRKRIPQNSKSL